MNASTYNSQSAYYLDYLHKTYKQSLLAGQVVRQKCHGGCMGVEPIDCWATDLCKCQHVDSYLFLFKVMHCVNLQVICKCPQVVCIAEDDSCEPL